eukprot:s1892_g3.t3
MVKGNAGQCGGCHRYWAQCNDASYVHQPHRRAQAGYTSGWNYTPWQDDYSWNAEGNKSPRKRTQSPRQRTTRPKSPRQRHQGSNAEGKGKGKGAGKDFAPPPPSTRWLTPPSLPPSIDPTPRESAAAKASSTVPALQPFPKPKPAHDAELAALRQMQKELKGKNNLPEDIKKVVATADQQIRKEDSRSHKQLVDQLRDARKKLTQLDEQWEAYRVQWANYIDKASQMWLSHVETYEEGENKFAEKRREALQHVQQTRTRLHEVHQRTMEDGNVGGVEAETAQEALDAAMTLDETDPGFESGFSQIKHEESSSRPADDRFRKTAFWPFVDVVGSDNILTKGICDFRSWDRQSCSSFQPPPLEHSVFKESNFCSLWEAQDRAQILEMSFVNDLFEVDFDEKRNVWVHSQDIHLCRPLSLPSLPDCLEPLSSPAVLIRQQALDPDQLRPQRDQHRPVPPAPHDRPDVRDDPSWREPGRPHFDDMPIWIHHLWHRLEEEGTVEIEEEGEVVYFNTFYISHHTNQRQDFGRQIRLSREFHAWERDIRELWLDFFDPNALFEAILVAPESPVISSAGSSGTILIIQHPNPDRAACLTTALMPDIPTFRIIEKAHSLETIVGQRALIFHAGVLDLCDHRLEQLVGPCKVRVGRYEYPQNRPVRVHDGLGLLIDVPPPLSPQDWEDRLVQQLHANAQNAPGIHFDDDADHEDHDETGLLARSTISALNVGGDPPPQPSDTPSSSSSSAESSTASIPPEDEWHLALVFTLQGAERELEVPWNDGHELFARVAHRFGIQPADIEAVHTVLPCPRDLLDADRRALLLQLRSDLLSPADQQLLLVDIEYKADLSGPASLLDRRMHRIPRRITRSSLIRLSGYDGHCSQDPERCWMWLNGDLIPADHPIPLALEHGSYLKIAIPAHPERNICETGEYYWPDKMDDYYDWENAFADIDSTDGMSTLQLPVIHFKLDQPDAREPPHFEVCQEHAEAPKAWIRRHATQDAFQLRTDPLWELWNRPRLRTRGLENEEVMLFDTWFLSSLGFPRCSFSRAVALDEDTDSWVPKIRQVWRDRVSPHLHVELAIVNPPIAGASHGGHLILLQAISPEERASILSSFWNHRRGDLHDRFAQLVPRRLSYESLLQFNDLDFVCSLGDYRCEAFVGDQLFEANEAWPIYHGMHLEVVVEPSPASSGSAALDVDPSHRGTQERTAFQLNAGAPSFDTALPEIGTLSQFVQDLHVQWAARAAAWEDESPVADVLSDLTCTARHSETEITLQNPLPGRNGLSIVIELRLRHPTPMEDSTTLLQLTSAVISDTERLTDGRMASNRRPVSLVLEELLPEPSPSDEDPAISAIRILPGHDDLLLPSFIEVQGAISDSSIADELVHFGHVGHAFRFHSRNIAVFFAKDHGQAGSHHYMFCNDDHADEEGAFLHTAQVPLTEHDIMKFLYGLGYWRAVIVEHFVLTSWLTQVVFVNSTVQVAPREVNLREPSPWPPMQKVCHRYEDPYLCASTQLISSDHLISLGVSLPDFHELFGSHEGLLCFEPELFDFPDEVRRALAQCDASLPLDQLDRLLIYCDGSSPNTHKLSSPHQAEEEGGGDTWAFVVLGERYHPPGLRCLGWTAQPTLYDSAANCHLGSDRVGADLAEKEALAWAALWRLSLNSKIATCFRSDSKTALLQAGGDIGCHCAPELFAFLRGLFQSLESVLPDDQLLLDHVRGHTGEGWNELCDWLAKQENRKSFYFSRPKLDVPKWRHAMPHLWMFLSDRDGTPEIIPQGLHAPPPDLPATHHVDPADSQPILKHKEINFTMSFCTANVNSLCSGADGHAGKVSYLRRQVRDLGFNFVGIQEARTPEICSCVDQERLSFFHRTDFRVVHKDARLLLVRADGALWQGWLLVGYAPHSGLSLAEKENFWDHIHEVAQHRVAGEPIIVMIDANASPGDYDGQAVFRHGLVSSSSTSLFRTFLAEHDLCLPCTGAIHQGPLESWVTPDGQHAHCIDYIAVPQTSLSFCTHSQRVEELDLGHGGSDHTAMCIELQWSAWCSSWSCSSRSPSAFDAHQITPALAKQVLANYEPANWSTDIEQHVAGFNQHVLSGLNKLCPRVRQGPKKSFIDDDTWALRDRKLHLKRKLRRLWKRQRDERLVQVFLSWRSSASAGASHLPADPLDAWHYGSSLLCRQLLVSTQLWDAAHRLKRALQNVKKKQIQATFETMDNNASSSQILHALRPILGPTNLKKLKINTLPYLVNSEGSICEFPAEATAVWVAFFQEMEGGERMQKEQQRALWLDGLRGLQQERFLISANELPRLCDLEASFRRINPTKATGPDHLHPAFFKAAPAAVARKTFCQLLKTLTHGQESLAHKGGFLHPLWKSKGPKHEPSSYRSILISSFLGKSLHRTLRDSQCSLFEAFLQQEQVGGRRHVPVTMGVHMGRAFLRSRVAAGACVGMVYLDLKEAFYRIVRQLTIGGDVSDSLLAKICARMGLPADSLADFHALLQQPEALVVANVPGHVRNAIRAIHADTFF